MVKGLSAKLYTQAQAGMLRNGEASYNNLGAAIGVDAKWQINDKNAIVGGYEFGAGTTLSANARLGYQRSLGNKSSLVFTGNATVNGSLYQRDSYDIHVENTADVNGKIHQIDNFDKSDNWKRKSTILSGRVGFNKDTKWGGYEVGAEAGYRDSMSPSIHGTGGSKKTFDLGNGKTQEVQTHFEYGREGVKGAFVSPYANVKVNLSADGALQAIGKADIHEVKAGIRWTF